jgi:hypothetical protein
LKVVNTSSQRDARPRRFSEPSSFVLTTSGWRVAVLGMTTIVNRSLQLKISHTSTKSNTSSVSAVKPDTSWGCAEQLWKHTPTLSRLDGRRYVPELPVHDASCDVQALMI